MKKAKKNKFTFSDFFYYFGIACGIIGLLALSGLGILNPVLVLVIIAVIIYFLIRKKKK